MTLSERSVEGLLSAVAERAPTPGGGAVASVVAGLSAALGMMVVNYSIGKQSLAEHEGLHEEAMRTLAQLSDGALALAEADAAAYGRLNQLQRLDEHDERRTAEWHDAVIAAIDAPRDVLSACAGIIHILHRLLGRTNRMLASDLAIAAVLAEAGARSAAWNVRINLPLLADEDEAEQIDLQVTRLLSKASRLCEEIEAGCR